MKKIIFFLVVIVLILNTKNVYSFGSKSSNLDTPQVVYPFKNADKFSDKANLLEISTRDDTNGKGNTYLINYNLSEGKNSKQYILLNENVPSVFFDERFISVKQDNSGFFVGTKETLFEFNSKIELKRKINIDEFKLEDNDSNIVFEFGNCAKVFNNNLYLMVNKCQYVAPNSKTYRTFVAEWCIGSA